MVLGNAASGLVQEAEANFSEHWISDAIKGQA
jgi:hypothetical protein